MRLASRGVMIHYESHLDTPPTHSLYYYFLHFRIIIKYLKQYNTKCKSGNLFFKHKDKIIEIRIRIRNCTGN